ncbi:polysaccharide export outer membrane protein [Dysgonomonas sp. PH5-45]|uniref:polysaccharide biosynthesis/export family protein n=1 Tax=unclassified Dysgonomonas TaxID=2630389 RepID=UPI0024767D95|nr:MULTISPECIES: polysaccharide biosynthesis/export family protein [unclassified Dysgonomonas]MDH6354145.1 polysaccharide export outer membrane protein [Dysgonomonas sp. PH5-45]MDH6387004.1 polysaccharide export outer membrane protein [Dysgonomonas sp. PH5-37]
MKKIFFILFLGVIILSSCKSKSKIAYFNNIDSLTQEQLNANPVSYKTVISPDDELSIIVSAVDPSVAASFNLTAPTVVDKSKSKQTGTLMIESLTAPASEATKAYSYLVNQAGEINFPTLGRIKLGGMTTDEATGYLQNRLKEYIKDPIVSVQILNFKVSVLGEVFQPGSYYFSGQRVSVLDALAAAKDLTIYGKRENILLIREKNGKKEYKRINLTKSDLLTSQDYFLQQNDVLYIEPTDQKQKDADVGIQKQYNLTIITSAISSLLTILAIIVK